MLGYSVLYHEVCSRRKPFTSKAPLCWRHWVFKKLLCWGHGTASWFFSTQASAKSLLNLGFSYHFYKSCQLAKYQVMVVANQKRCNYLIKTHNLLQIWLHCFHVVLGLGAIKLFTLFKGFVCTNLVFILLVV